MKTPEPKPLKLICSVCGLDWKAHGKTPSLEKCIDLLKLELAKKPAYVYSSSVSNTPQFYWQTPGGDITV